MSYTKITPSKNWVATLNNNEQDFANRLYLNGWQKCTLLNGVTGGLGVRWNNTFIEIVGKIQLPDKEKECDIAQIPADWNGALGPTVSDSWEDVWVATGNGSTLYQLSMKIGGGNGNKLHFYQHFISDEKYQSSLIHIHRIWLKG